MSINLSPNIPANVVEIGQEVTQGVVDALNGATSPDATNVFLTRANTFNTADAAVRITQTGAGEAFRVEDAADPDATPFVIDAGGNVGVKTASPSTDFEVVGRAKATTLQIGSSAALTGVATDAEAQRGASTALAITPANVRAAINNVVYNSTTISVVGNGAASTANIFDGFTLQTSATLASSNARRLSSTNSNSVFPASIPGHGIYRINFAKPVAIRWAIGSDVASGTGDQFQFLGCFVAQNSDIFAMANQECANIGFGFALYPNGNMKISARNATGVTSATVASGIPMVRTYVGQQPCTEVYQYSDGTGNLFTYIDGVLVNTITAGPTTASDCPSSFFAMWVAGLINNATTPTAAHSFVVSYPKLYLGQ